MLSKRLINSNDAAAGGACTTNTLQILGDTSCVAYYKMSDASDESGNYNGTPTGVNFNVQGKYGNAGVFPNSTSKINIPNNFGAESETVSYSLWFKTSSANGSYMFAKRAGNNTFHIRIDSSSFSPTGKICVNNWAGTAQPENNAQSTAGGYNDNAWHHFVFTYDGNQTTKTKCFIDGVYDSGMDWTYNLMTQSATNGNNIGNYDLNGANFSGSIDQIRIFNKTLSSSEVTTLYNEVYCVPTIVPTDYFNTLIFEDNASSTTQEVTGLGFKPDFMWTKARFGSSQRHYIYDSVRGTYNYLSSNESIAQQNRSFGVEGINNGIRKIENVWNRSGANGIVAWNWKAGGAVVSNTDGSITSQVSANVDAGFSIVKYTGNGTAGATIGHGLNAVPEMVIVKTINSSNNWAVYNKTIGNTKRLSLDEDLGAANQRVEWNSTTPTSSVLTLGGSSPVNTSQDYIAYFWHSVDGYSKIGSYVGTGATGHTIVTGFRPAFVMLKRVDSGNDWNMFDNKRSTSNPINDVLRANLSNAESADDAYLIIDFLSNGFQLKGTSGGTNASGGTYIFMAFAEEVAPTVTRNATNPFGDSSEVALYKFEDDATDAEGNHNATAAPNVTYASGYIDKAAVFNGTNAIVNLPSSSAISQANNYTWSFWAKPNGFVANGTVVRFYSHSQAFSEIRANGILSYGIGGSAPDNVSSAGVITDGVWQHIAITKSSTTGVVFYVNGQSVFTSNQNGNGATLTGQPNNIGGWDGTDYGFKGSIDQFRIFNRVLDSGEVTALYNE